MSRFHGRPALSNGVIRARADPPARREGCDLRVVRADNCTCARTRGAATEHDSAAELNLQALNPEPPDRQTSGAAAPKAQGRCPADPVSSVQGSRQVLRGCMLKPGSSTCSPCKVSADLLVQHHALPEVLILDLQGQLEELQAMYAEWPFFQSTFDLIEMVLAKADMRIASLYDQVTHTHTSG